MAAWWDFIRKLLRNDRTGQGDSEPDFVEFEELPHDNSVDWQQRYHHMLLLLTDYYPHAVARILEECGENFLYMYDRPDDPRSLTSIPEELREAVFRHHQHIFDRAGDLRELNKQILKENWEPSYFHELPDIVLREVDRYRRCVQSWPVTGGAGLPYWTLTDYQPLRSGADDSTSWCDRRLVWHFKGDIARVTPSQQAAAIEAVIRRLVPFLTQTFGERLPGLVLVCLPASSQQAYTIRFHQFAARLCRLTGMLNGFEHITIKGESGARHMGQHGKINIIADRAWFRYKRLIIFDDVMTTGRSFEFYADKFRRMDAFVIGGVFIGHTAAPKKEDKT